MDIQTARRNAGLTQQQLAERIGVSRAALANWEVGICMPNIENAIQLSRELSIPLEQVFAKAMDAKLAGQGV